MIVNFKYVDIDNYDELEDDEIIIGLPENINFNKFIKDFIDYSYFYMKGYEIADVIDNKELFKEQFPDLSKEDAEYFITMRENGISARSVVVNFLEKFPQYQSDYCGNISHSIVFNEYNMKVDGKKYY